MGGSEFNFLANNATLVQMAASKQPFPSTMMAKAADNETKPFAKTSYEYSYDSDEDSIAKVKEENSAPTASPKNSLLSKVKAKLSDNRSKKPKPTSSSASVSSASSASTRSQARKDTIFSFEVLSQTRP